MIEIAKEPIPLPGKESPNGYGYSLDRTHGFGENLSPVSAREKALVEAENMDKTIVEEGSKDQIFWLIHNTPGIDYIIAGKIDAQHFKPEKLMNSKGEITGIQIVLEPSLEVEATLHLAVVTSRESDNLIKDANNLLEGSSWEEDTKTHLAWWRSFWSKSFIQIPDKLMENLWYCGLFITSPARRGLKRLPASQGCTRCWISGPGMAAIMQTDRSRCSVCPPLRQTIWNSFIRTIIHLHPLFQSL